jgi:hypothetical protein
LGANPIPFIDQALVPGAVPPGGAQFTLTVNGAGFVNGSIVNWNGSALATTYVSAAQLTAVVPAAKIALPGTASISVTSPPPGGGTSNWEFFQVTGYANLTFAPLSSLPAPHSVVADFNGDGKLDLATNSGVLLGNGDGTFQPLLPYPTGFNGTVYSACDYNGDGKLDLATSSGVMLGNGDGTFQAPLAYPSKVISTYSADVSADINGDGILDSVNALFVPMLYNPPSVAVVANLGDGPTVVSGSNTASFPVSTQAIGDFNGDGKLDLAFGFHAVAGIGYTEVALGNGDGTFQIFCLEPGVNPCNGEIISGSSGSTDFSGPLSMVAADFTDPALNGCNVSGGSCI